MGVHPLVVEARRLCDRQFQCSYLHNEAALALSALRILTSAAVGDIEGAEVWLAALRVTISRDAELAARPVLTSATAVPKVATANLNSITEVRSNE